MGQLSMPLIGGMEELYHYLIALLLIYSLFFLGERDGIPAQGVVSSNFEGQQYTRGVSNLCVADIRIEV